MSSPTLMLKNKILLKNIIFRKKYYSERTKTHQAKAKKAIAYPKDYTSIIWNDNGETVFDNKSVPDTNHHRQRYNRKSQA